MKNHSTFSLILGEAGNEFRQSVRGLMVPIVFILLTLYMILIMLSADYMRQMGVVGIPRNSAHLSYLMASGQCLWVLFVWAWLFSQTVMRDQQASLNEMVLATPSSLRALFIGRYFGALGVGLLLASSMFVGLASAPLLASLGILPADAVGPIPWASYGWAWLIFILPNAAGAGALYLSATLWTRDTRGAFIAAAATAFVWMIAMIILKDGDVNLWLASAIDPSAYAEAERQADSWTPSEKMSGFLALTPQFLLNRLLWFVLPVIILVISLSRVTREHLILERKQTEQKKTATPNTAAEAIPVVLQKARGFGDWFAITLSEAAWHINMLISGFGFRLALVMLVLAGALGSWVNFVQQAEGPMVAYPQALLPFLTEFFYLIMVFILVGFLGLLIRRDDQEGFCEWVDAARAPLAVNVTAKALAALFLVVLLCAMPAISSILVTALSAPQALDIVFPFAYIYLVVFPSLLELAAAIFFIHALIRPAGMAYTMAIIAAFIAIINHEVMLVEYPPGNFGIPPHADISELAGWSSWLAPLFSMAGAKIAATLALFGFSWLLWRRGTALTLIDRLVFLSRRAFAAPGVITAASIIIGAMLLVTLHGRFISNGEYESSKQAVASNASWEQRWWSAAAAYSLNGGRVEATLNPAARNGSVNWLIEGLQTPDGTLQATLPHGVDVSEVRINQQPVTDFQIDEDHLQINTPACSQAACELSITLAINFSDWPVEDPIWLDQSGIWLRAENLLPRLGHDRNRLETGPADRKENGLPVAVPAIPERATLSPLYAVAPAGSWSWQITVQSNEAEPFLIGDSGSIYSPLDFAAIWQQENPANKKLGNTQAWFSAQRSATAELLLEDVATLQSCVAERLGVSSAVKHIVQTPRHLGDPALHHQLLWLPEDAIWDIDSPGFGHELVRYKIASAIAQRAVLNRLNLRLEPGANWLVDGLAGWTALNCMEQTHGSEIALALKDYLANDILEAFSADYSPIDQLSHSLHDWLPYYAALALDSWSEATNKTNEQALLNTMAEKIPQQTLSLALANAVGETDSDLLLGSPRSYDVAQSLNEEKTLQSQRWIWHAGGWDKEGFVSALKNKALQQGNYWFDAYPAFERTVNDNLISTEVNDG